MRSYERAGLVTLNAAKTLLNQGVKKLERRIDTLGKAHSVKIMMGMYSKLLEAIANSTNIEQVCSIEASVESDAAYISIGSYPRPEMVNVDQKDLATLCDIARGGLYDEAGDRRCCVDCLSAMDKGKWDKCPLRQILPLMMCKQYEDNLLDDGMTCPYAISKEFEEGRMRVADDD